MGWDKQVVMDVYELGELIPIKMIRLVRVVRVARLFPHFQTLNRIVQAIGSCVLPMANAFFILLVVTSPVPEPLSVLPCACVSASSCALTHPPALAHSLTHGLALPGLRAGDE